MEQNILLVYSSCNILLSIFPTFYLFGFLPSLILGALFLTSVNYHLFQSYKYLDQSLAIANWICFYFLFEYNLSKYFLISGIICYLISQIIHFTSPHHFFSYFFHMNLHKFCYLSVWIELFFYIENNFMVKD